MSIVYLCDSGHQAGAINESAGIGMGFTYDAEGNNIVVTAVSDSNQDLKLITWKISLDGKSIIRMGASSAGNVSLLDIVGSSNNRFVTAVRAANGNLLLIAWQVHPATGEVWRLDDTSSAEGTVSLVTMTQSPLGDGRVLIAVRDGDGNLVVKNWEITPNGTLKRVGDTAIQGQPAGAINCVAVGAISKGRVVTAVGDSNGKLKLIVWEILANGGIKRLSDSGLQGEAITLVNVVGGADGRVYTAVRNSTGNLKLVSWQISSNGKSVTRIDDSGQAGGGIDSLSSITFIAGELFAGFSDRVVTAICTKEGSLNLLVWQVAANGAFTRVEEFSEQIGKTNFVRIAPLPLSTHLYITAVRDNMGRLKLNTWRIDDQVSVQTLANNIMLYPNAMSENTAKVVPPFAVNFLVHATLNPKGKIVMNLGQPRDIAGMIYRDLFDDTGTFSVAAPTSKIAYPLDSATQTNATDNHLIRLQDHSLLAIKNGYIWSDLSPRPAWFDMGAIKFGGSGTNPRARNAVFVFRSTDWGQSWLSWSLLDAAVIENGKYGWPQGDYIGGFDRTEIYQDPWTKAIYISAHGDGGPYKKSDGMIVSNHAGIIFVSKDNGKSWNTLYDKFGSGTPYVMTSTPEHPLIVFRISGKGPWLHFLKKESTTLSEGESVAITENGKIVNFATDEQASDVGGGPPHISIARIGSVGGRDRVWIAYPALNGHNRQVYKICVVTFGGAEAPNMEPVVTIQAEDPTKTSCILGTFVQDDLVDSNDTNKDNLTLFYWIEAPPKDSPEKDKLLARYTVLFSSKGQFQSGYLSVNNGQRRYFTRSWIGHYFQGGFFYWDGKVNFLAQWRENDGVKGNILSIQL